MPSVSTERSYCNAYESSDAVTEEVAVELKVVLRNEVLHETQHVERRVWEVLEPVIAPVS